MKTVLTKDFLYQKYIIEEKTLVEIGLETNLSPNRVSEALKSHDIQTNRHRAKNPKENLLDQKFGKLTVVAESERIKYKTGSRTTWFCTCECGGTKIVSKRYLKNGKIINCGCESNGLGKYTGFNDLSGSYWSNLKYRAGIRNIEFNITIEEGWELLESQKFLCAFTGEKLVLTRKYKEEHNLQTASLDRIDSSLCYSVDNCQWIHKDLQFMKSDMSDEDFINWCSKVSNYRNN